MTTPLFLLRCIQMGISMGDMELLSIGLINDMYAEGRNDEWKYCEIGSQADMESVLILVAIPVAFCYTLWQEAAG